MSQRCVLVIDTQPVMADSLSLSLQHHSSYVTRACSHYPAVAECLQSYQPAIVVLNLYQDTLEADLEACRMVSAAPGEHLLVLLAPQSLVEGDTLVLDAIEAGADGVLVRTDLDLEQLVAALEDLESGRSLIDPEQLREALRVRSAANEQPPAFESLTPREREIADLLSEGCSTSAIATSLTISERTVHTHISNILSKLGVRTRVEAVALLYQWRRG